MEALRGSWTDERLDHLNERIDERFDRVDERFEHVERRLGQVESHGVIALSSAVVVGFGGMAGLIAVVA